MKKDAVQRQLPTAFVWVQGPRFGSFAERQKIQRKLASSLVL